jgi:hypothetical protein
MPSIRFMGGLRKCSGKHRAFLHADEFSAWMTWRWVFALQFGGSMCGSLSTSSMQGLWARVPEKVGRR